MKNNSRLQTGGILERLVEPRATSLSTVDTASHQALAAAAVIAKENASAGRDCRAKFKFTPRKTTSKLSQLLISEQEHF